MNPTTETTDIKAARFYDRTAFVLLAVLLVLRLIAATQLGLAWDESYYWQWSRHLDLCYYDAGPGIALVIRAGTALFGNTPFGVRFVPVLMSVIAYGLTYLTARRWFDRRTALWTLILASVAPLLAVGSVLATYDLPQVFFWAVALYAITRAVQDNKPGWWYAVGLCVGLGTLTKPLMILFAPGVLLFLILVPEYRKHLTSPHPYLAFVLAIACLAPLFIWNAQHDNANWLHTLNRSNRSTNAAPGRWLGEFWGGQALVVGPLLLLIELAVLWRAVRHPRRNGDYFITAFTLPMLAICTLVAIRSKVEINWPVAAHLTGLLAAGTVFEFPASTIGKRIWRGVAVGLSAIVTVMLFFPGPLLLQPFGPFRSNATWEKINEMYGWSTIAEAMNKERQALAAEDTSKPVFFAGTGYRVCSILAFYLPGQPRVEKIQIPDTRHDQYNIWTDESKLIGQNAIVAIDGERPEQVEYLRTRFHKVSEPIIVNVSRPRFIGPVKVWYLYRCEGLHL